MEYVEGKTLRQLVPVKTMQDAIGYAMQIAEALHEAHTKGIVHRDIKAENIMVNSKKPDQGDGLRAGQAERIDEADEDVEHNRYSRLHGTGADRRRRGGCPV